MNLLKLFQPKPVLSDTQVTRGLRLMAFEGMASNGYSSIMTSGFLAAFALALGANNFQIGLLAAIPFILQIAQVPTILLVERIRRRKAIAVSTWLIAQLLWFPMALIPFIIKVPGAGAVSLLLVFMTIRSVFSAITNCSWNSWARDLIPQRILGSYYARRLALSTLTAAVFSLGAAFFVNYWNGQAIQNGIFGYTYALLFGAFFLGLTSPILMSFQPEPLMQVSMAEPPSLWKSILMPIRDKNFRQLMRFLLFWSISVNIAVPFFVVYMLKQLGLPLALVIGLNVVSQLFSILFLNVWGPLADRFGSKTVLSLCASLYVLVILGFTFSGTPERYFLTVPLLIVLNIFAGIAGAGISLTIATIGFKMAPRDQSVSFLAGASLATNLGAGIGPLLGGLLASFFSSRNLILNLTWVTPQRTISLGIINLRGFDFLFILTFILGLITLNLLALLREEGASGREAVLTELRVRSRSAIRSVISVTSPNFVDMFPLSFLNRVPGIDVAIGVTAYQLADTAKTLTVMALRSGQTAVRIARTLHEGLDRLWKTSVETPQLDSEVARQVARGAMHAVDETEATGVVLTDSAISGIISSLKEAGVNPYQSIRGMAYGLIEGANETGIDIGNVATETIIGAKKVAKELGLEEDEAVRQALRGVMDAAHKMGSQVEANVNMALSHEIERY